MSTPPAMAATIALGRRDGADELARSARSVMFGTYQLHLWLRAVLGQLGKFDRACSISQCRPESQTARPYTTWQSY